MNFRTASSLIFLAAAFSAYCVLNDRRAQNRLLVAAGFFFNARRDVRSNA